MKKFFVVIALGAFVACNDSATTTEEVKDSTVEAQKELVDSSADARINAIDSSAEAKKDQLDSTANKVDSASKK